MNDSAERACDAAYESMVNICYNCYQLIYVLNIVVSLHVMYCYVRQCSLVLKIVLYFFKCLGFCMHFISLYGALSLHNCSSSGSLVFAHLGRIN